MSCSIVGFDGRRIHGSRSVGSGVFAAFDWTEMVLNPGSPIMSKAMTEKGRLSDFPAEDCEPLRAKLGHYSKVQSANSEDTVSWSVFGAYDFNLWLPALLTRVFEEPLLPDKWTPRYWERQRHPETGQIKDGPESEITLRSSGWCIEVESKWLSDLDGAQGTMKNWSQVQMRAFTARRNANDEEKWRVLVIAPGFRRYPPARKRDSVFASYFSAQGESYDCRPYARELRTRAVTWEYLAQALEKQRGYEIIATYLKWRLNLIESVHSR